MTDGAEAAAGSYPSVQHPPTPPPGSTFTTMVDCLAVTNHFLSLKNYPMSASGHGGRAGIYAWTVCGPSVVCQQQIFSFQGSLSFGVTDQAKLILSENINRLFFKINWLVSFILEKGFKGYY